MAIAPCAGRHIQLCLYHGDETDGELPILQKGVRCVAIMYPIDDLKKLRQEVCRLERLHEALAIIAMSEFGIDIGAIKEGSKPMKRNIQKIINTVILIVYPIAIIIMGIALILIMWRW